MAARKFYGREMVRDVGKCIYCGKTKTQTVLTKEHVFPHALGADAYLRNASCPDCQRITKDFEHHLARNVFGDLRIHSYIQTRHPDRRPDQLVFGVTRGGINYQKKVPVKDQPLFVVMPVWDQPALIDAKSNLGRFSNLRFTNFFVIPDNIRETVGAQEGEVFGINPTTTIDAAIFARAVAKIAYCSAVGHFGLHGFDAMGLPDAILGKNDRISDYVGTRPGDYPPPHPAGPLHSLEHLDSMVGDERLIISLVRFFANSRVGGSDQGMPTYYVVTGEPLFPLKRQQD